MLEAAGFPVVVNPEAKLAAIARRRGWFIEHWERPAGGPRRTLAIADAAPGRPDATCELAHGSHDGDRPMKASSSSATCPASPPPASPRPSPAPGKGVRVGPLELVEIDPLELPGPGLGARRPRLAGICGSDLATLDGRSSRYFEHIVSFPFVPGHEVVGDVEGGALDGRRAVLEPVLGCEARGIEPPLPGLCRRPQGLLRAHRLRAPASRAADRLLPRHRRRLVDGLVAHESQLHEVPDDFSDEAAVMVEPAACAVHAACAAEITGGERVVVLGAGTLGLCVIAALRALCLPGALVAVAKHPNQRKLARELGADQVVKPGEHKRAARRLSGSLALESADGGIERLTGGVDLVVDCVGSARLPRAVPRRRPARRPDRARRHARRGESGPRPPLAARGRASRRLRLRD